MNTEFLSFLKQIRFISLCAYCLLMISLPIRAGKTLAVTAGSLQNLFDISELKYENDLTLKGTINGTDIKVLRTWASENRTLDLKDCRIVGGGEPYYLEYKTEDDVIGSYMFGDKEFKKLVLPKNLKKIGSHALSFCGETIEFPETLTWLGDHAFTHNNFKQLHIPATLVHIGNGALNGNILLKDVTIDKNHPEFVLENGYLYTRDHTRLLSYFDDISSRAESFTIRSEVKVIDDKAFNYHRTYNITLNEGLEYIGEEAFKYALNNIAPHQKKLVIPNSVTYIGASAFDNCYMDEVIISDNVEELQDYTFATCFINLIHLPAKLKHIGRGALSNNSMYNLVLPEGLETVGEYGVTGSSVKKLVVPKSVQRIEPFSFEDIFADTIDIQAPLDSIPETAFYNCENVVKLILPKTLKRIGKSAFYACYRLKDCQLPDGLEEIGAWALSGADNVKEWHIPASVKKMDWAAFAVPNFTSHTVYMYSKEPPSDTDLQVFYYWTMENSVLYVPQGCLDKYQYTAPWSYFGAIREFEPTGIKPTLQSKGNHSVRSFDLMGRPKPSNSRGIRIKQTPEGARKIILH